MEIWKDIEGYEGFYQVSNLGRLKSLSYYRSGKEGILKGGMTYGYHVYLINFKGKRKSIKGCRAVAKAFIPNPENKRTVNHKNGIKTDDRIDNLEWNTYLENNVHALRTGLRKNLSGSKHPMYGKTGIKHKQSKPIIQYSINGEFIKTWDSLSDASRELKIGLGNLYTVLNGKRGVNHAGGFKWKYNPRDCWKIPYFNEDGSVNKDCILFKGISEDNKNKYLQEHTLSI